MPTGSNQEDTTAATNEDEARFEILFVEKTRVEDLLPCPNSCSSSFLKNSSHNKCDDATKQCSCCGAPEFLVLTVLLSPTSNALLSTFRVCKLRQSQYIIFLNAPSPIVPSMMSYVVVSPFQTVISHQEQSSFSFFLVKTRTWTGTR